MLPFFFKGVTYHDCAITEDSRGWCDATDGFFVQKQYCVDDYAASTSPTPLIPYCSLAETLNATWAAATFTDGSEDQTPYVPSSTCEWTLLPSNGGRVELTLLKLDTEVGLDVVRVLDPSTGASLVPGGLSGSMPDLPKVGMASATGLGAMRRNGSHERREPASKTDEWIFSLVGPITLLQLLGRRYRRNITSSARHNALSACVRTPIQKAPGDS